MCLGEKQRMKAEGYVRHKSPGVFSAGLKSFTFHLRMTGNKQWV